MGPGSWINTHAHTHTVLGGEAPGSDPDHALVGGGGCWLSCPTGSVWS